MDLIRSRIEQSAKVAAETARQLSSLDDMAQNDEYVQSEGLNVSEKKVAPTPDNNSSELPSVVEDLSDRFVGVLSSAARTPSRPINEETRNRGRQTTPSAPSHHHPKSPHKQKPASGSHDKNVMSRHRDAAHDKHALNTKKDATRRDGGDNTPLSKKHQPPKPVLLSSVAALYEQNNDSKEKSSGETASRMPPLPSKQKTNVLLVNERHAHILHELHYDSDAESTDDEDVGDSQNSAGSDLEMGRLPNAALHDELEQEIEDSISRQHSLNASSAPGNGGKDVNRFMKMTTELESEREGLLQSLEPVPEKTPTNITSDNGFWTPDVPIGNAGDETKKALRKGLSWVKNVASPQFENFHRQVMTKVSEVEASKRVDEEPPQQGPMIGPRFTPRSGDNAVEEKINKTTSAAFLADDDMAELERIRMRNSPSKVALFVQAIAGNPRLAFIGVTLFLAVFAYFWSRHKSVDDEVL